ncbi:MAG: hypothetical protein OXB86_01745 [Bdellovibrionales bacterium]|nr:hypothetical protein [Bdellovibrionales bacterium]
MLKSRMSIFSFILLLGSCVWDLGSPRLDPASIVSESSLEDSVQRELEGDQRGRRSGSSSGSYKCRENNSCTAICEDLFDDDGVVENCLDLSVSQVVGRGTRRNRGFEYILDIFDKTITYPALTNIDGNSFGALMQLSVEHWVNLTDDVSEQEAKALLAWIASDKKVTEVVREHGSDGNYAGFNSYEGLIRLMKEVGNRTGCDEYEDALTKQYLSGRFTFCCIAYRERNAVAEQKIVADINKLASCEDTGNELSCPPDGGSYCPGL